MTLANLYTDPSTKPYTLSAQRRTALNEYFAAWTRAQPAPRRLTKGAKTATNPERPAKRAESRVYLIQIQPTLDAAWVQAYGVDGAGVESTTYRLDFEGGLWRCPCEAHTRRGVCKHSLGVEAVQTSNKGEGYVSQLVRLYVGARQAPEILGEGPRALSQGDEP